MALPDIIPTAEAARTIGVSVNTVNRMAQDGRLVPIAKGSGPTGARFFKRADVNKARAARVKELEAELRRLDGFPAALPNECENTTEAAS